MKLGGQADRSVMLKTDYEEQWNLAADADREKASLQLSPGGYSQV
jgi:hypothetical protein